MVVAAEKGCLLNCSELRAIQITYFVFNLVCEHSWDPKLFHSFIFAKDLLSWFVWKNLVETSVFIIRWNKTSNLLISTVAAIIFFISSKTECRICVHKFVRVKCKSASINHIPNINYIVSPFCLRPICVYALLCILLSLLNAYTIATGLLSLLSVSHLKIYNRKQMNHFTTNSKFEEEQKLLQWLGLRRGHGGYNRHTLKTISSYCEREKRISFALFKYFLLKSSE